jgi:hypothetical protein
MQGKICQGLHSYNILLLLSKQKAPDIKLCRIQMILLGSQNRKVGKIKVGEILYLKFFRYLKKVLRDTFSL